MTHALSAATASSRIHHDDLRAALEETDYYYTLMIEAGENPNLDSIGYASEVALETFRALLNRPRLSAEELQELLRAARQDVRATIGPRPYTRVPRPVQTPSPAHNWADLMAACVTRRANG